MSFFEETGWLAIGGYFAAEAGLSEHFQKKKINEVSAIVNSLSDEVLERKVREEIGSASGEKYNEIWGRIEEFKRDNPHLIQKHLWSSYWNHVGKERFPFTYESFCTQAGKNRLTKTDEKMLATYRGWTVTLLMNTYGKYSVVEATRVAFRQVFGVGKDSWTREFG